jgi:hypothetical protein
VSGGPPDYPDEGSRTAEPAPLIYKPAKRERVGLIIGLSGPSWSGKTFSALRLARGMAGPNGRIAVLDTERGRARTYADDFTFDHGDLVEPFSPGRYADAAALSKKVKHDVLIVDSMSHEHAGPGGVLEMHEAELKRMVPNGDFARREAMKMAAWIKPKIEHKAMVQRLLQLNSHLILCFRAEEKTEIQMLENRARRLVATPINIGFQPITAKDMAYELTIMLGFDPKAPGVPIAIKLADKFRPFIPLDRVLDESSGARLAAWARGETPEPFAALADSTVRQPADTQQPANQRTPPAGQAPPPDADRRPSDTDRQTTKTDRSPEVAAALIADYAATTSREAHFALVDDAKKREQIGWLRKNRRPLFDKVNEAVRASLTRHQEPTPDGTPPRQGALV